MSSPPRLYDAYMKRLAAVSQAVYRVAAGSLTFVYQQYNRYRDPIFFGGDGDIDDDDDQWSFLTRPSRAFFDPMDGPRAPAFSSVQQYVFYHKAKFFHDETRAEGILASRDYHKQRKLAASIRSQDWAQWQAKVTDTTRRAYFCMFRYQTKYTVDSSPGYVCIAKTHDLEASSAAIGKLIDTSPRDLVFARQDDRYWGIGFDAAGQSIDNFYKWGINMLGLHLMYMRDVFEASSPGLRSPLDQRGLLPPSSGQRQLEDLTFREEGDLGQWFQSQRLSVGHLERLDIIAGGALGRRYANWVDGDEVIINVPCHVEDLMVMYEGAKLLRSMAPTVAAFNATRLECERLAGIVAYYGFKPSPTMPAASGDIPWMAQFGQMRSEARIKAWAYTLRTAAKDSMNYQMDMETLCDSVA